jgi:AcrR family transcriptional regulator
VSLNFLLRVCRSDAAYHHFAGKIGLFRAVFVQQEEDLAAALAHAGAEAPDSWTALVTGCRAFLAQCVDQSVRQIVLLDGPAVLGWDEVRKIEYEHTLKLLQGGVRAAARDGWLPDGDLTARSHLIFGALCEAGMLLARADNPATDLATVADEAEHLLNALTGRPSSRTKAPAR